MFAWLEADGALGMSALRHQGDHDDEPGLRVGVGEHEPEVCAHPPVVQQKRRAGPYEVHGGGDGLLQQEGERVLGRQGLLHRLDILRIHPRRAKHVIDGERNR